MRKSRDCGEGVERGPKRHSTTMPSTRERATPRAATRRRAVEQVLPIAERVVG